PPGGRPRAVDEPARADAGQRDGEDQSEGIGGAAEERGEHPVPDQLHEQEGEADGRGRDEDERAGRGGGRCGLRALPRRDSRRSRTCRQQASRERQHEIQEARRPDGEVRAQQLEREEGRVEAAPDRAERVRSVEQPGAAPARVGAALHGADAGRRGTGLLYGANTLGAVGGSLYATFLALELLGTNLTVWSASLLNLVLALAARLLAARAGAPAVAPR